MVPQVALITCMMSAAAPDQAGPECWAEQELDYSLVEVRLTVWQIWMKSGHSVTYG